MSQDQLAHAHAQLPRAVCTTLMYIQPSNACSSYSPSLPSTGATHKCCPLKIQSSTSQTRYQRNTSLSDAVHINIPGSALPARPLQLHHKVSERAITPPRLRLRHQNSVALRCPNESLGTHAHQFTIAAGLSGEGGSSASVSCMDATAAGGWMACTAAVPGPDTTSLIRSVVARIFCMARQESARLLSTLFYQVPCNPAEKHLHKAAHTIQFETAR